MYDKATETVTAAAAPGIASRAAHAAVPVPSGDVLILGVETVGGEQMLDSMLRFILASRALQP